MNLEKLNDKKYLYKVSQDADLLNREINETRGYILYLMEKEKITPSLEALLEKENVFSLNFILRNYELNKQQLRSIKKYFAHYGDNQVVNEVLESKEVEQYLKEEKLLPKKTILSLDFINNHAKEIVKSYHLYEFDMGNILKNSFKKMSVDEFLSISPAILENNPDLFLLKSGSFSNKNFKKRYKEVYLKFLDNNPNEKPYVKDFESYHFEQEDKDMLMFLLKSNTVSYSRFNEYDTLETIPGVKDILSPLEFFTEINSLNIKSISESDIEKDRNFIEDKILTNFKDNKRYSIDIMESLINIKCSAEQFANLVTPNFITKLITIHPQKKLYIALNKDDADAKVKKDHFDKILLKTLIIHKDDDKFLERVDIDDIIRILHKQYIKFKSSFHVNVEDVNSYIKTLEDIYVKVLPKKITTDNIESLLDYNKLNNTGDGGNLLFCAEVIPFIEQVAINYPSVNLFALLTSHYSEAFNKFDHEEQKKLTKIISNVGQSINQKDAKDVANHYKFKLPTKLFILKNSSKVSLEENLENNFLRYKELNFKNVSADLFKTAFDIKKEFKNFIIKEKKYYGDRFIYMLLRDEKLHSYLKQYVKIPEILSQIKEDKELVNTILSNKIGKELLNIDNTEYEKEVFNNALIEMKKYEITSRQLNQLEKEQKEELALLDTMRRSNNSNNNVEEKLKEKVNLSKEQINALRTEGYKFKDNIGNNLKQLSFGFFNEQIENLLKTNNFFGVSSVKSYLGQEAELKINDYIAKLDFNSIVKNMENDSFTTILLGSLGYNNNSKIKFTNLKESERKIVCQLLLEHVTSPEKIFQFFPKEDLNFAKQFIIEHLPSEVFHNSNFFYRQKKKSFWVDEGDAVFEQYSNEEIIKLYKKLEKKGSIFCNKHEDKIERFFSSNFADNETQYLELVDYAKNNDLKLYVILSNSNIFSELNSFKEAKINNKDTIEKQDHDYFIKHFDISLINQGISLMLDEMKMYEKGEKDYNHTQIAATMKTTIFNFNYQKESFKDIYGSNISEKDSYELLEILLQKAPMLLTGRLGSIENLSEYLKANFGNHAKNIELENFIMPDERFCPEYFNINAQQDNYQNYYVNAMFEGLINYYINNNKGIEIGYLSYLIQQKDFFGKELDSDYAYSEPAKFSNYEILDYLNELEEDTPVKKLLAVSTQKYFLERILNRDEEKPVVRTRKI